MKDKEDFRRRGFPLVVPHLKVGNIVWTYGKDHIIGVKGEYRAIGLRLFDFFIGGGWGCEKVNKWVSIFEASN